MPAGHDGVPGDSQVARRAGVLGRSGDARGQPASSRWKSSPRRRARSSRVDPAPIQALGPTRDSRRRSSRAGASTPIPSCSRGRSPSVVGDIVTYPFTIAGTQVHDVDQAALIDSDPRPGAARGAYQARRRSAMPRSTVWPDWVTTIPTNAGRITLTLAEPQRRRPSPQRRDRSRPDGPILGIDLGERRIGLAIADRDGLSARPLATVNRARVAGRPRTMPPRSRESSRSRGSRSSSSACRSRRAAREGPMAEAAATWANGRRGRASGCHVTLRDERLSSHLAESRLGPMPRGRSGGPPSKTQRDRYRERVDREAAAIILQDELDARHSARRDRVTVRSGRGPRDPEMPSWRASDGRGNPPGLLVGRTATPPRRGFRLPGILRVPAVRGRPRRRRALVLLTALATARPGRRRRLGVGRTRGRSRGSRSSPTSCARTSATALTQPAGTDATEGVFVVEPGRHPRDARAAAASPMATSTNERAFLYEALTTGLATSSPPGASSCAKT